MFLTKKSKIMDMLVDQSILILKAAKVFSKIPDNWQDIKKLSQELAQIEAQADSSVHKISDEIERIFILPLDKEDIRILSEALDDIVDYLEEAANRIYIYNIEKNSEICDALKEFTELILKSVELINQCILMIKSSKLKSNKFPEYVQQIQAFENEGDKLHRQTLKHLMGNKHKPMFVIKWREIFHIAESTLDKCEDIAVLFGKLRIKYG